MPGRVVLAGRLVDLLHDLRRDLRVRLSPAQRAEWGSLTIHQLEALVALDRGGLTMRELCAELDITESAATALSDRLVARGLVERQGDARDRRLVRLALSDEARAVAQRYRELVGERARAVLATLSSGDLAALVRICAALAGRPDGGPSGASDEGDPVSDGVRTDRGGDGL